MSMCQRPTARSVRRAAGAVVVGLLALVAAGCGSGDASTGASGADGRPTIVATTSILGDVVANVVGDLATVTVLMPPGTDPHDFEPSAQQMAALRTADLIVANGLLLEEGLRGPIDAAEADGVPVLTVAPQVDPLPVRDAAQGDEPGDADPHVWQDPLRMATAADVIAERVAEVTDLDAAMLRTQAAAYRAQLEALDAELAAAYGAVPAECRTLVTDHDAFGYLAARYGLEIVGTIIPSGAELAESGAAELAALAEVIAAERVPAIFSESTFPSTLADALAREVGDGVALVTLYSDSLGEPGSGADTYVAMLRTNAERITGALC